jgi:type IV secretory pathway TrbL component
MPDAQRHSQPVSKGTVESETAAEEREKTLDGGREIFVAAVKGGDAEDGGQGNESSIMNRRRKGGDNATDHRQMDS